MPRATALRGVAGNVQEIAFLLTLWAFIGRCGCRNEKAALGTFPVSEAAFGTDIRLEPAISGIATVSAYPFFLFLFHLITSLLFPSSFRCLGTLQ